MHVARICSHMHASLVHNLALYSRRCLQVSVDSSGSSPAHFRPLKAGDVGILANITIQPTCTFTNALPFPASVTLLEAWYGKPDAQLQNAPAHTNKPTFVSKVKHASVMADAWSMGLPQDGHIASSLLGPSSPIHANVRHPIFRLFRTTCDHLVHAHIVECSFSRVQHACNVLAGRAVYVWGGVCQV